MENISENLFFFYLQVIWDTDKQLEFLTVVKNEA